MRVYLQKLPTFFLNFLSHFFFSVFLKTSKPLYGCQGCRFGSGVCAALQWAFSAVIRSWILPLGLRVILHVYRSVGLPKIPGDHTFVCIFPDDSIKLFLTQEWSMSVGWLHTMGSFSWQLRNVGVQGVSTSYCQGLYDQAVIKFLSQRLSKKFRAREAIEKWRICYLRSLRRQPNDSMPKCSKSKENEDKGKQKPECLQSEQKLKTSPTVRIQNASGDLKAKRQKARIEVQAKMLPKQTNKIDTLNQILGKSTKQNREVSTKQDS